MKQWLTILLFAFSSAIQGQIKNTNDLNRQHIPWLEENAIATCAPNWASKLNQQHTRKTMYLREDSTFIHGVFSFARKYTYSYPRSSYLKFDYIENYYHGDDVINVARVFSNYDECKFSPSNLKYILTYNQNNQIVSLIELMGQWSLTEYDTAKKTIRKYINGKISTATSFRYYNNIINDEYTTIENYTYNAENKLIADTSFLFNMILGIFEYNELNQYFYSGNNVSEIVHQKWNDNHWDYTSKTMMTYDNNNNRTSYNDATWNGTSWVHQTPLFITYNSNQTIDSVYFKNSNDSLDGILTYKYPLGSILPTQIEKRSRNESTKRLELKGKIEFTYDSNDYLIKQQWKSFQSPNTFIDDTYLVYKFQDSIPKTIVPPPFKELTIYPNPAINQINISYTTLKAQDSRVTVTDIFGNQIYNFYDNNYKGDHLLKIPVDKLAKGIYLIHLQLGDEFINSKFIKQ